jgi:transglutaminase-like putative cysteine protease
MNPLKLYSTLLYAQVTLGVACYCVAVERPTLAMISLGTIALSWLALHASRKPGADGPIGGAMPRWVIFLASVAISLATILQHHAGFKERMIEVLSEYILLLNLVKLFDRRSIRDDGQVMLINGMLVTCSMIFTIDLYFAGMVMGYLAMTMLTVMVMQIKIAHDHAQAADDTPRAAPPAPPLSRAYRIQFRDTALVLGILCLAMSVAGFLTMPRGSLPAFASLDPDGPVTGFNPNIQLDDDTQITQSLNPVMYLKLSRPGAESLEFDGPVLVRGNVLDRYDPRQKRWNRGRYSYFLTAEYSQRDKRELRLDAAPMDREPFAAEFTMLRPMGETLFSIQSPVAFRSEVHTAVWHGKLDNVLTGRLPPNLKGTVQYTVACVDRGPQPALAGEIARHLELFPQSLQFSDLDAAPSFGSSADDQEERRLRSLRGDPGASPIYYARRPVVRDPRVRELAESVMRQAGLARDPKSMDDPADHLLAAAMADHLRARCAYTLDLPALPPDADPISSFLFDSRKGHCEYFASALAAMLRSIGVRCRVVTGFMATEFNSGGFYVVREADAHAWVEVYHPDAGWRAFDATPDGGLRDVAAQAGGWLALLRGFYEHLEFQWITNVIGYDDQARSQLIGREINLHEAWHWLLVRVRAMADWLDRLTGAGRWSLLLLAAAAAAGVISAVAATILLARWAWARWASRWRNWLPRLAAAPTPRPGAVDFYAAMLRILARSGLRKPVHQTPAAFARRLVDSDPVRFAPVAALTDLFYEIRFGDRPLDTDRRRRADALLNALRRPARP